MKTLTRVLMCLLACCTAIVAFNVDNTDAGQSAKRKPRVFAVGKQVEKKRLEANLSRAGTVSNTFSRETEIVKPAKSELIEKNPKETVKGK